MTGILILSSIIMGFLGSYVASEKNRSGTEGFLLGLLFSIIGVIIVALLPTKEKKKDKPKEVVISEEERKRKDEEIKEIKRKEDKAFGKILLWFFGVIALAALSIYLIEQYL